MGNKGNTVRRKKHYDEYTIMLVGKMGAGKSSLGNFLLQEGAAFETGDGLGCVTVDNECRCKVLPNGIKLRVIDTPGFGDFRSDEKVKQDVAKAFYEAKDGVDAFLFVISSAERIGREMVGQFTMFERFMDHEHFFDYVIPVFTKVDQKLKNRNIVGVHSYEAEERLITHELENVQLQEFNNKIIGKAKQNWMCISSTCDQDDFYYNTIIRKLLTTIDGIRIQTHGMICTTNIMKGAKDIDEEERANNKKAEEEEIQNLVLMLILRMIIDMKGEDFMNFFTDGEEGKQNESNQIPGATGAQRI